MPNPTSIAMQDDWSQKPPAPKPNALARTGTLTLNSLAELQPGDRIIIERHKPEPGKTEYTVTIREFGKLPRHV